MTEPPRAEIVDAILSAAPTDLLTGLTSPRDDEYLRWLVDFMQGITGVAFAFIGELAGADLEHIRTLAVQTAGGPGDDFEYDLLHTPCARVLDTPTVCAYPQNVAAEYPQDLMLVDMGIESYVGLSLAGPEGRPLGLLVLLDTKPMSPELVSRIEKLLYGFRSRTQTVLEHRRTMRALKSFESALDPTETEDLLAEFIRAATNALNIKAAFVAHYDDNYTRLRTEVAIMAGKPVPSFAFAVAGSPCEGKITVVTADVRERFPEAEFLAQFDAEAFLGCSLYDLKARPIGYFAMLHDRPVDQYSGTHPVFRLISERIGFELRRQQVLAERRAMERRMIESLGILAGGIAHDFNNLLVGIVGNADIALMLDPDAKTRELLEGIIQSAEQAGQLCNRMLAQAGRARISVSRFDVRELVSEVVQAQSNEVPANCEFGVELGDAAICIDGDKTQIAQVLTNLITNAIDAIGDKPGQVRVRASIGELGTAELADVRPTGALEPGRHARIEIHDNGVGMDSEARHHMFDPFFTTKYGRHGLGLASTLGLVERHRGGVQVESTPGEGAIVTLWFPLAPIVHHEVDTPIAQRSYILIVDDEPQVRKVLSLVLREGGYNSLVAEDGLAALDIYERERDSIRLVLLDVNMPRLDGIQTLARLRAMDAGVKVILSSGRVELDRIESEHQPDAIVPKPFRMKTLMELLEQLLD